MSTLSGQLDGGEFLAELASKDPRQAQMIQYMIDGINRVAKAAGVSATGDVPPPKGPDSVSVKTAGEMLHVSINHSGPVERGIRYFTEIHTTPSFDRPIVEDHGTSRTRTPYSLPTFLDDGMTKAKYYVRVITQNPGGPPSEPFVVGGPSNPTAFEMNGSTSMTLLPSNGSGTAPNNGQSAGQGLGKFQSRGK